MLRQFWVRLGMRRLIVLLTLFFVVSPLLLACQPGAPVVPEQERAKLTVSSQVFKEEERIPAKYTCEGQDVSPPLAWSEPPARTKSLVLIVDDPDAPLGIFTHWVLFNLPPDIRELSEGVPTQAKLPNGALHGRNDFMTVGYRGPCPPPGTPHRYRFTLYALNKDLDLSAGVTRQQVLGAMQEHILVQGQLIGTYQR